MPSRAAVRWYVLIRALPPPRKNRLVRPRCSVPVSGGCQRTPCSVIHCGTVSDSRTVSSASFSLPGPVPTPHRSRHSSSNGYVPGL